MEPGPEKRLLLPIDLHCSGQLPELLCRTLWDCVCLWAMNVLTKKEIGPLLLTQSPPSGQNPSLLDSIWLSSGALGSEQDG